MSSIFSNSVQESNWFLQQTSIYDRTNNLKYQIPQDQIDTFTIQFHANRSELLHLGKNVNDSLVLENLMRRCFKKCNKFVLEDWIDYDELNCTLKCSSLHKNAYNILKNKNFDV